MLFINTLPVHWIWLMYVLLHLCVALILFTWHNLNRLPLEPILVHIACACTVLRFNPRLPIFKKSLTIRARILKTIENVQYLASDASDHELRAPLRWQHSRWPPGQQSCIRHFFWQVLVSPLSVSPFPILSGVAMLHWVLWHSFRQGGRGSKRPVSAMLPLPLRRLSSSPLQRIGNSRLCGSILFSSMDSSKHAVWTMTT